MGREAVVYSFISVSSGSSVVHAHFRRYLNERL